MKHIGDIGLLSLLPSSTTFSFPRSCAPGCRNRCATALQTRPTTSPRVASSPCHSLLPSCARGIGYRKPDPSPLTLPTQSSYYSHKNRAIRRHCCESKNLHGRIPSGPPIRLRLQVWEEESSSLVVFMALGAVLSLGVWRISGRILRISAGPLLSVDRALQHTHLR
jgi:hypothetical protein